MIKQLFLFFKHAWIYFNLSLLLSFFCLFSFYISGFVAHFIVFNLCMELWLAITFWERDKFNFLRVICKQRNWQWIFSQNVTFFVSVSVRISQNIQNEVWLERSIFADIVAYQFIYNKLNRKLNGSRRKMYTSFHMGSYTTLAARKGLIIR